jgi:hypothetical protein
MFLKNVGIYLRIYTSQKPEEHRQLSILTVIHWRQNSLGLFQGYNLLDGVPVWIA